MCQIPRQQAKLARDAGNKFARGQSEAVRAEALAGLKNPYSIGDHPALTQTSGWQDAWTSRGSAYAVAARDAADLAAAVKFARRHNLRLVVKGGGHSYFGASNAPDSLLVWTRAMNKVRRTGRLVYPRLPVGLAAGKPARATAAGAAGRLAVRGRCPVGCRAALQQGDCRRADGFTRVKPV